MLAEIRSQRSQRQVVRMANLPGIEDFLAQLDLDEQGSDEVRALLSASGIGLGLDELLDGPFRPKRRLRSRTRFSDGSFSVFYSSLDTSTAEAEIRYWFPRYGGRSEHHRTAYYLQFSCIFDGIEKDLRPKIEAWPDLVHDKDYSFCNQLGSEAMHIELDGLVTRSARHSGANVPVFRRRAVSNPQPLGVVAVTYDPDTGAVTARSIEE